ncbi:hypothetical protein AGRO_3996 [Agrobacterium sp. ATCC 31749]|nr:hypothetical protein AGRO_3996 [Agrobacterium sp. ATCC 31749]
MKSAIEGKTQISARCRFSESGLRKGGDFHDFVANGGPKHANARELIVAGRY